MDRRMRLLRDITVLSALLLSFLASAVAVRPWLESKLEERVSVGAQVNAVITDVSAPYFGQRENIVRLRVAYLYEGEHHEAALMWVSYSSHHISRFNDGETIVVYVDRGNPRRIATQEAGYGGSEGWWLYLPSRIFALLAVCMIVALAVRLAAGRNRKTN